MSFDGARSAWLRETLQAERLTHVVDVGANPIEEVPYAPLLKAGGCRLTGFEPQTEAFEKLQNIKGPNETYFPFAVGDGETQMLNLMQNGAMTSFFAGKTASTQYLQRFGRPLRIRDTVELETVALDQADAVASFDLLKIDIQGGEVIVFEGAAQKLQSAVAVIPEVRFYQLYDGEPMFSGVDADLRARGFALHKFLFSKALMLPTSQVKGMRPRAHRNQLIDGDAVYIRDLAEPDTYSDEDLKHLAILADGVWYSFDLVVRALDMLVGRGAVTADAPAAYVQHLPQAMRLNEEAVQ